MNKNDEIHYGYKEYINADTKTKFITKYSVTNAASHNCTEIENIIDETDNKPHANMFCFFFIKRNNM